MEKIERITYRAMNRPPEERADYVAEACGDDLELRREVASLVAADERVEALLARSLAAGAGPLADAEVGSRIGPYEVVRRLGEGGMSVVYLAVRADDEYRKRVALKVVRQGLGDASRLRRFRAERQILASLEHPNVARLLDGGTTPAGLPYFVMELVDGEPLDVYCDRRRLPLGERLDLFREVCAAVHYAHRNLVVHRDLKPSNVLVTADGVPKLLDFGIAKLLNPDLALPDPHFTETWLQVMTPEFASPEQLMGDTVTTASDVYGLGVVLYQLLTGRLPRTFPGHAPVARARLAMASEISRPSDAVLEPGGGFDPAAAAGARRTTPRQLARRLRRDLDDVVLKALRAEPERRYGSAEQLAEDLRRYRVGLPVSARKDAFTYRARKFLLRHRLMAAALAGFVVATLAFAGVLYQQVQQTAAERDRAEETVRFVERMLSVADPAQGPGASASVRAALDRGVEQLDALADQPLLRARLEHFLAVIYANQGVYDTADSLLRSALAARRGHLGEHGEVVDSLNGLGHVALAQGRYAEAAELLTEAAALGRRLLGPVHESIASSLVGLGWARELQGDLVAAEGHQREALAMRRQMLGGEHEAVADSLRALAGLRWQLGDASEGEALFRRALGILERRLGGDHPEVGQVLNDLGGLLHERGALEEAAAVLRRSVEIKRLRLGAGHPMVLNTENKLADLLRDRGDLDAAENLGRRVLGSRIELLGEGHPHVVQSRVVVARTLRLQGDWAASRELFAVALVQAREALGDQHPSVAGILTGLGQLELEAGDPQRAAALLRQAVDIRVRALPPGHWRTARSQSLLGAALAALGRTAEAEPLLRDSYAAMRDARGDEDLEVQQARARLQAASVRAPRKG